MPIYAYRCTACGHAKDVLQKLSDPVLTQCPACGQSSFSKQLTAAGFQLKGSGWYVTDFRGGNTVAPKEADGAETLAATGDKAADPAPAKAGEKAADKGSDKGSEKGSDKGADKSAAPAAAPVPAAAAPAASAAPAPAAPSGGSASS